MVLKQACAAAVCALVGLSGVAAADEYRPDEFFGLDLPRAVMSPKRLGPQSTFAPVAIEAKTERSGEVAQVQADPPKAVRTTAIHSARSTTAGAAHAGTKKVRAAHAARPRTPARTKLARHSNPLDAQARDTRIQVWPCNSGGICNWQ